MESWRTAITDADGHRVIIRGHDLVSLMARGTYADVVALLLGGHMPDEGERRLIDAILIGIADHGAGSPSAATARMAATGNRQAPEAAVAAGILAIGVYPKPLIDVMHSSVADLLTIVARSKL